MFDTPLDAWYVWLGLSAVSVAVLGVAVSLPTAPIPDAAAAAETIDRIAASDYEAAGTHALDATQIRVGPRRIGLRNEAGTAHATLAYPVVPAPPGTALSSLVRGVHPSVVFDAPSAFERRVARATERPSSWRPAGDTLAVRRVSWGGVDVTIVGTLDATPRERNGRSPLTESTQTNSSTHSSTEACPCP